MKGKAFTAIFREKIVCKRREREGESVREKKGDSSQARKLFPNALVLYGNVSSKRVRPGSSVITLNTW